MTRNRTLLIAAAAALILASLACSFSASTANIKDAYLTTDPESGQPTELFSSQDTFYLLVDLANAPDDTELKAIWIATEVEGAEPDFVIDEVEIITGLPIVTFDLSNEMYWPEGSYKVDLYLNGDLDQSLAFEVR